MGRAVDALAPLGFVVLAAAGIASRNGVNLPGGAGPYLVAGLVLILVHLLLRWESVVKAIGGRQLRYGGNTAVLTLVVLGILVAVNYIAARRPLKKDFTKNQRHSLSDQTKKVVQGLSEDVRILYFERAVNLAGGGDARLKDYAALSPHVKLEFVDPFVKPARAREYDVRGPWPIVVVEKGSKRERAQSDGEQDLTNALIKVTRAGDKTVCFAEGEGERDIDDSGDFGFSAAREALGKSQYQAKKVVLAREGKVPADCSMLVLAGPRTDLLPQVSETVKVYVRGGGKLLAMAEPELKQESRPNFSALLKEWNLEAGRDVVVDVSGMGQLFGTGELTPLAVEYPYHEITRGFGVMTAFHEARSLQAGTASTPGVVAQNLVQTSPQSWAETDLTLKSPVQADATDKKGPIALGAVATVQVTEPEPSLSPSPSPSASAAPGSPSASPSPGAEADEDPPKPRREGRVVAFGDADFASNALLGFQGNRDFFLNVVAWLAEDADLISIRPKEPDDQRLFLTGSQQNNVALLALVVLPGIFVALGVWSWWRRR